MKDKMRIKYNNIAVIHNDKDSYFAKEIQKRGIKVVSAYKKTNLILRILRKIHFRTNFPFKEIWYNKNYELKKYDTVIIFDGGLRNDFVQMIRHIYSNKRIILWYWNPVRNSINPRLLNEDICEKWSYSPIDCENFGLKFNTTFYFKELNVPNSRLIYDIFFVGKDKGRLAELLDLKKKFEELNLNTNFHITPTKQYMKITNPIYKDPISYDAVLAEIGKSKAILDILSDPNDGLSLRPMESIFHKKKLITNSRLIDKYDFYRPQNIFILGKNDLNDLPEFLNSPYKEIDEKIINKYDFEQWLSRF